MLTATKIVLKLLTIGVLAAIAVAGFSVARNIKDQTTQSQKQPVVTSVNDQIEPDHFQAVFLSSGQVYFGKLQSLDAENYKLSDVYYLKGNETNLVKLGNEAHKPQDAMVIPVANVTFWENLANADQFNGQLQ